ncbi:uncharacterized protein LOC124133066 isoform X2 [Haliotis rufescens]|uniref:uncharacterized protein LOC124133066 isoform X2 n=1 Tax=Haliotis rufescens TaxID=6454 RepID=UPI001EB07E4E|nr:uncharacterized protein LOC124133066 isoform X2 [Haliotis rufescens]
MSVGGMKEVGRIEGRKKGSRRRIPGPAVAPVLREYDHEHLLQCAEEILGLRHEVSEKSRQSSDVSARYSAKYRQTPRSGSVVSANSPYLPQSTSEECLKCLLRVPHKKCESHKYIRVGGGYRHGYWYIKCLLEELEMQRQREMLRQQRLEAIKESNVKAIKTYIRTKSGRLVERIVFLNEEDYEAFKQGKNVQDILKRYLNKDEAAGLESWDKDEVKAIKTLVRTKSGRLIEKLVYVSKQDYEDIKAGRVDAKNVLKKYVKTEDGEQIEGWGEAKMKTIKTYVRTKSGRLIEKVIMISQDDYDAMIRDGKDPSEIIKQYLPLEEGQTLESWQSAEPMKAIKTKVRTKSGRIIEKTIYVSADDYEKMMKGGGDPADILKKYLNPNDGDTIESWEKAPDGQPMKVVKTYIRTKSGRLIEKQVLLTEDEFRAFQESGGDPEFLKKFIKLEKGEIIEDWEKASTVYSATDDPEVQAAKPGTRIVGKDGAVYEVVVDPVTGKKYRKKIGQQESDVDSGIASMSRGKGGKRRGGKGGGIDEEETPQERHRRKQGKRDADSDSDYSYKSHRSAGGTRHVRRRRKRADGTYSDAESYHSSQDEDGQARRRRRRRERKHGSDSAHSYCSVVSAGGTRHVKRRRKRADGTYSASESYHSSDSDKPGGGRAKNRKKKKKERREHGSDSDHSYYSDVSAGGTHHRKRRQRIRDKHGNVIGHGNVEDYTSPENSDDESVYTTVSDGKGGKVRVKKQKPGKAGKGGKAGKKGTKKGRNYTGVFSDESSDDDDVDLENMTEEEKKKYFAEKAKRKEAREKRRREKYGDKYDEMVAKHEKLKKEWRKPVFSDESSDDDDVDLENMTEEEKKKYFAEKAKRKEAREKRRREKYGDKYDEMMAEHDKRKKDKRREERRRLGLDSASSSEYDELGNKKPKTKGARKDGLVGEDSGLGPDGRKKGRRNRDGNEGDDESDDNYDLSGRRKKKGGHRPGSGDGYEYKYDDKGRIISKKRIKKDGESSGSEYEYEYDADGKVKAVKKKRKGSAESDGDYFEVDEKGQIKLKEGKKKIDLSKLTADDLRKLGIDPNLSKHEIARLLKEKFGGAIQIVDKKKTIGTKKLDEYDSDVKTDDLANDSDLDISTLRGPRRVNVLMRRGGQAILDHIKKVMDQSNLGEDYAKDLDEKGDIDFLSHYRLVDPKKLDAYAKCFAVEDEDYDTVINAGETRIALDGVPTIQQMTAKQMEYVLKVLKIDDASQITFRMFSVISALSERVTQMDPVSKHLIEICDLLDIQRKMNLYKAMFYCNVNSDRDSNFIKADSLRIELIAGGLNWKQQQYIMERLQPNYFNEISFLDYICYIPLFLSMHDNIIDNPLDMSDDKYDSMLRKPSGGHRQRDINPLGQPLDKKSSYQMRQQALDLLEGRINIDDVKKEDRELLQKYTTLPKILESAPSTPRSTSSLG